MGNAIRLISLFLVFCFSLGSGLNAQNLSDELQLLIKAAKGKNSAIRVNNKNIEQAHIDGKTGRNILLP